MPVYFQGEGFDAAGNLHSYTVEAYGRLTTLAAFDNAVRRVGYDVKAQHFFFAAGQTIGSFGQLACAVGSMYRNQVLRDIMYFEDLTKYSYYLKRPIEVARNVGWLDATHPFPKAPADPALFGKLCDMCASTGATNVHVNKLRSVQSCPLCGSDHFIIPGRDEELFVGMTELWIPWAEGDYLVAPSMILHFIASHQYNPPKQLWGAVEQFDLAAPYVGKEAYLRAVAGAF